MTARSVPPDPTHPPTDRTGDAQPAGDQPDGVRAAEAQAGKTADPGSALDEACTLESYGRLRDVVDVYRATSTGDPDQLSSLKSRIMEILAHELARGPTIGLVTPLDRQYSMTLAALRAEVRAAVDAEPGVHARRVCVTGAHVTGMTLDLRVTMTMSSRSAISELQDRLRPRIAERLLAAVGVKTGTINLIAEDIYDE